MNSNPLFSLEAASAAQKDQGRARVKIAVFSIVAVHVAGLMALLLTQGCKRETPQETVTPQPDVPTMDATNFPSLAETNPASGMSTTSTIPPYVDPGTPPTPPVPPTDTAAAPTKYVVQQGDSFYTIAKAHGITQKAIEAANPGVDPKKLKPKQEINLPAPVPAAAHAATTTTPAPDAGGVTTYTVKSGDNLSSIAKRFSTTPKAIKALNNLATDQIKVNQKLKIPAKAAAVPETAPVVPTMAPTEVPPAPVPPAAH